MKSLLKIGLIFLFFLVLLGAVLFKILAPSKPAGGPAQPTQFPVATDVGVQDQDSPQIQAVRNSFTQQIDNPDKITLERAKIVQPYALQDWSDENKGGEALLKYDQNSGWQLVSLGGGAWDVPSLVDAGVPEDIAQELIGS